MARTVNEQEYAQKRSEILDVAQRLVFTKGYERMSIGDILAELKISSGAFYHYFPTKPAVLEALIERLMLGAEKPLRDLVHETGLSALEKLQRYFLTIDQMRTTHKAVVVDLIRVWYADDNAIVRQKVDQATTERRAPLLTEIVRQGIQEGIFTVPHADYAGEVILALWQGMSNTHSRLMLSFIQAPDQDSCIDEVVNDILSSFAAYTGAIERVLGAPAQSLSVIDAEQVKAWVSALQSK